MDGDDDDDQETDRLSRFHTAYPTALATDTQGYSITATDENSTGKTPQELTAISWAAFQADLVPEMNPTHRIQALDTDDLFDRLKLASHMMKQKEAELRQELVKAGIEMDGEEG